MKAMRKNSRSICLLAAVLATVAATARNASAANATWSGTTNGTWATTTNWSASPVPGSTNTATFNNAGSGNTILDLAGGVQLLSITFDTASAAAYTIGSGGVGAQTLTLESAGTTQLTTTTGTNQLINANILLGVSVATSSYTFTNNSVTGRTLTLAGNLTGNTLAGTAGAKTVTLNGAGDTAVSGIISNGGGTSVALTKSGAGVLTLSGSNNYTGATTIGLVGGLGGGTLRLSGSGKLGTGAITIYGGTLDLGNTTQTTGALTMGGAAFSTSTAILIGSGTLNLGNDVTFAGANNHAGGVISGSGGGVINLLGNRTFTVGDSTATAAELTISANIANGDGTARGLSKAGNGTLVLSGANTFSGTTTIAGVSAGAGGGILQLDFTAATAPTNNILYSGTTAGQLTLTPGLGSIATLLLQGKDSTTNSQALGNVVLGTSAGAAAITVNSGSSGTMNLSLGTITRSTVSLLSLTGPASGSITTTQAAGRLVGSTYTSSAGATAWAGVTSGTIGFYTGTAAYAGGNIVSGTSSNLYVDDATSGDVVQGSGTTSLATLSLTGTASRTLAVGAGKTLLFASQGGVQSTSSAGDLTIGTLGNAGTVSAGPGVGAEFIITNASPTGQLTINSVIADNATGAPALNITGPGKTVLTGSNTYGGVTYVTGGILEIQNGVALGTTAGNTQITSGASVEISGGITSSEAFIINGTGIGNGGALRNLSGSNTLSGNITPNSAVPTRINSDSGLLTLSGTVTNSSLNIFFGGAGDITVTTGMAVGPLTKDGAGTLTLAGTNTYTGLTTVNAGKLLYGGNNTLATGAVTVSGGTLDLATYSDTVGAVTLSAGSIIGSGTLTGTGYALTGSGTISTNLGSTSAVLTKTGTDSNTTFAGVGSYTGATNISSGTLTLSGTLNGGTAITLPGISGGVGGTGVLVQTSTGLISGTSSFAIGGTYVGTGTSILAGNNSYTGLTTISLGVLRATNGNALGTTAAGTTISNGAALELAGNIAIGTEALSITGTGRGGAGALRNISGDNSYAGAISLGAASRINSDAGALTLTGSMAAISGNVTLTMGGAGNINVTGNIANGGGTLALVKDGTGIVTLSGINAYSNATTVNAGILTFSQTSAKASGTVTAVAAGTIGLGVGGTGDYSSANVTSLFAGTLTGFTMSGSSGVALDTRAGNFNYTGNATGTRALTKLGANTLTMSGSSNYSGATLVNAGTLLVSGTIGSTSGVTVASAAALLVNGRVNSAVTVNGILSGTGSVGALTLVSGGTLAPGNSAGILNATSLSGTSGAMLSMEIGKITGGGDPVAGTDYDQLNSSGGVTLNGTSLTLTSTGFNNIQLNDKIFLVLNGSGPVVGTFAGLAQDDTFVFNTQSYQISYLANWTGSYNTSTLTGGNDIAILAVPEPSLCMLFALGSIMLLFRHRRVRTLD